MEREANKGNSIEDFDLVDASCGPQLASDMERSEGPKGKWRKVSN